MTRFTDDWEATENEMALWEANEWRALREANEWRALRGRKGQKALREIEAALLAMPVKRLVEGSVRIHSDTGDEVCVLGAYAQAKGVDLDGLVGWDDYDVTIRLGKRLGMTKVLAHCVAAVNDEDYTNVETEEARYERVLAWVRSQILEAGA